MRTRTKQQPFLMRAATTALLAVLTMTAQTAWADTETVSYIDADGKTKSVPATVLTGNEPVDNSGSIRLAPGWYVVKNTNPDGVDVSYENTIKEATYSGSGTIHIILTDGAEMAVNVTGTDYDIILSNGYPLAIYGQSAGTGRLTLTSNIQTIYPAGGLTINGGIVSATTSNNKAYSTIFSNGAAVTINGGQLTATPGDTGTGISTGSTGTITLGGGTVTSYGGYIGTVTVDLPDGYAYSDGSGNFYTGTLNDAKKKAIAGKTLRPTPDPAHFADNGNGTYTIKTATGWGVFCDALQDNNTYNRFSGKTVVLGANIGTAQNPVTRMAGSADHEFRGTFDGDQKTLTVSISSNDGNAAPFREIMGATIRNLKVSGTVSGHKHSAGLVSYARGADSSVENTIENCLVATDVSTIVNTDGDCYLGGIVGHGFNCKLTIRGCAFTGSLTSPHNYTGGLQGWSDGNTLILEDDIFAASSVNAANVGFHPIAFHVNNATTTATVTNVYYTVAPTCTTATRIAAAGKAVRSVTAGTDVILYSPGPLDNTNTYYNVSGIRAYTTGGLYYNHNLYYGSGDRLSILLGNTRDDEPLGYRYTYAFSGGTADEYEYSADDGETSYHLTMPDEDVTISVNTAALAPIDWATVNQGNSADPYMIYNKDQLLLLAYRVNGTHGEALREDGYKDTYFQLAADISYSHATDWDDKNSTENNYEAIGYRDGSNDRYFRGHFDGAGHTVSGIRIHRSGSTDADNFQGLFGQTWGATIRGLRLADARITGYDDTGGIAGSTGGGTVTDCHVANDVCIHAVQANAFYHGGIVGDNGGTVENCTSAATLTIPSGATYCRNYGGIAGTNPGTLTGNLAIGAVVPAASDNSHGAIVGWNNGGTLQNNYYTACKVGSESVTPSDVGCGYINDGNGGYKVADVITDDGAVPGYFITLGENLSIASGTTDFTIPAHGETAAVTYHVAAEGAQVTLSYTGTIGDGYQLGIVSNDGTADHTVSPDGDGKYIFTMPAADVTAKVDAIPWAGTGDKDDPYLIEFPSQLDLLAYRVNGTHGETRQADGYKDKYFKLAADITYSHATDWDDKNSTENNFEAIGGYYDFYRYFNGNFDGGGHTVSGIRIYSGGTFAYSCQGLFGITGSSANIHDVTLADTRITGYQYIGGIVGVNQGTVSNCHVAASVIVRAVQNGAYQHGGIVGRNRTSGTVTHCTSAATLTIADGVTDCQYYGGIAGVNEGSLTDNLATGAVVPAADYNTYGAISGVIDGTLQHNYYTACTLANVKNATGVGCGGIDDGGDYTVADITDDDGAVPALRDNADNTKAIALLAALASTTDNHTPVDLGWGEGQFPLQLAGRTLYKDGAWNTLCLPFDVSVVEGSPLDGAEVKTLTGSAFAGGTLTLNFSTTSETTLTAGKPYLVRWTKPDDYVAYDGTNAAECSDLVCPIFNGVTVSTATANVETDYVDFIGTLSPTVLYEDGAEKTNLYMGSANKLYYPTVEGFKLNACRGYFKLKGVVVNGNGNDNGNENAIRSFDINFGEETTGVALMDNGKLIIDNEAGAWYDLSGRKLSVSSDSSAPSVLPKGVYIHNGRKVVIK